MWLGVIGPRAPDLVGAKADGWAVSAPYVPSARLPELNEIITTAARTPAAIPAGSPRLYNVMGSIRPAAADALNGPVARWVDTLTTLHTESGMRPAAQT